MILLMQLDSIAIWLTWLWSRVLDLATGVWNASLECGRGAYELHGATTPFGRFPDPRPARPSPQWSGRKSVTYEFTYSRHRTMATPAECWLRGRLESETLFLLYGYQLYLYELSCYFSLNYTEDSILVIVLVLLLRGEWEVSFRSELLAMGAIQIYLPLPLILNRLHSEFVIKGNAWRTCWAICLGALYTLQHVRSLSQVQLSGTHCRSTSGIFSRTRPSVVIWKLTCSLIDITLTFILFYELVLIMYLF